VQILEALPKMVKATANAQLATAFEAHLEQRIQDPPDNFGGLSLSMNIFLEVVNHLGRKRRP
jgi:hypothetical protein